MKSYQVIYVMGVSGVGKSTIGILLSEVLQVPFFDGDDYHPASNVLKMSEGQALNDRDRLGWLQTLNTLAKEQLKNNSCIIACSALKKKYRDKLSKDIEMHTKWFFLHGSFEQIRDRINQRKGHFMPSDLLKSQFDTLEEPKNAIYIDISLSPNTIVKTIKEQV